MPLAGFTLATAAGSMVWTSLRVGGGYAAGSSRARIGSYASGLGNLAIVLLLGSTVATLIVRARLRSRAEPGT